MVKYFIILFSLITGSLAAMYFVIGVPRIYNESPLVKKSIHKYDDHARSIEEISILAFYFVPVSEVDKTPANWKALFKESIEQLTQFHTFQFQGRSHITYTIYPEPIRGLHENRVYDTDNTQQGNPEGLKSVALEIERRVLRSSGDLFRADFPVYRPGDATGPYQVLLILYEGVGASGSDNIAFVSSSYLSNPANNLFGTTVLIHEFYHTLGIPDAYDVSTGIPTSADIMGFGRFRPLEKAYLGRDILKGLGF